MDWREFAASIVGSLAWPAAVVVLVVLLRSPLVAILGRSPLRRLKLGPTGAEVEWHQIAAEVRAEVVAASSPMHHPSPADDLDSSDIDGLAMRSPAKAIEAAHGVLIAELSRIVGEAKPELLEGAPGPHVLLKLARRDGVLSRENAEAVRGMLTLRDLTARRPETATPDRAIDFIVMARAVLYALGRVSTPGSSSPPSSASSHA